MDLDKFLLFIELHGSILNIAYYLFIDPNYILDHDLTQECLAETDCVTSTNVLRYLVGYHPYWKQTYIHPYNTIHSDRSYMSNNNILSQIRQYPCLIEIEIQNVVELGAHVFSIIAFEDKCYLIQSYAERYTYKIDEYSTLSLLLNYISIMFDEIDDIETKIHIYNKLIHSNATTEDYDHNIRYNKLIMFQKDKYIPSIVFVNISDFHLPSSDIIQNILSNGYLQNIPELNQRISDALNIV